MNIVLKLKNEYNGSVAHLMARNLLIFFVVVLCVVFVSITIDNKFFHGRYRNTFIYLLSKRTNLIPEPRFRNAVLSARTGELNSSDAFSIRGDIISINDNDESILLNTADGKKEISLPYKEFQNNQIRIMIRDRSNKTEISWKSTDIIPNIISDALCVSDFIDFVDSKEFIPMLNETLQIKYLFILERPIVCNKN